MARISKTIKEDLEKAYKRDTSCEVLISGLSFDEACFSFKLLSKGLKKAQSLIDCNKNCRNCGANSYKNNKCLYCGT